jgi:5'-phosphate synthase pdxT subunit
MTKNLLNAAGNMTIIGVLAVQGDFAEHIKVLKRLGVETREVRLPEELEGLDGLIIPGGESTTIGKVATDYNLMEPLREFGKEKAIWGTCARAIFLSQNTNRDQPLLKLMDISTLRNAFGRQLESFEVEMDVPALKAIDPENTPFSAVFIRGPQIESINGSDVEILAQLENGEIVAAQQGKLMATSFHPELNSDDRFHKYFLHLVSH